MSYQEVLFQLQANVPTFIGAALGVLALIGMRELLKETSTAIKKV